MKEQIMSKIEIKKTIEINAPIEKIWDISYNQFSEVDQWISNIPKSTGSNPDFDGDTSCTRVCTPSVKGFSKTEETLEFVDIKEKTLRYRVAKGLPGFVKSATNTWYHEKSISGTRLTMHMQAELKGFMGALMKTPMKKQMGKIIWDALEEMQHHAETGQPHPRKVKANEKWAKKHKLKAA